MKQNLSIGFIIIALFFVHTLHAGSGSNSCEYISGHWRGEGHAFNWFLNCRYHGSGTISKTDNQGDFILKLTADKDSGNFLCPKHIKYQFPGTCVNRVISIKTKFGSILENFSNNAGNGKGKLSFALGITVNLTLQFTRVVLNS